MHAYFSLSDTVYDVTERYPILIDLLAQNGFENLRNAMLRKTVGRTLSIEAALRSRGFDPALFAAQMAEAIEQERVLPSPAHGGATHQTDAIQLAGVLPCPIRMQLLERLDAWIASATTPVQYQLQAASMGLDWLRADMTAQPAHALADIYLSAGFSLFFDQHVMGEHLAQGVFQDLTGAQQLHPAFENERICLRDPRRQYAIIGVVPAVFMVNTAMLGNRPFPRSWEDLMQPAFAQSVVFPTQDLDLFNAVLLGIYARYGAKGVQALGRSMCGNMHPSQMVKAGAKKSAPAITVMPYFFTWMAGTQSSYEPVWPSDGAIISPIFLLTKKASQPRIQPLVDFLFSVEMGSILSADGKFPSTNPVVQNGLTPAQTFLWPGWDFIYQHDISALLAETEALFYAAAGGAT